MPGYSLPLNGSTVSFTAPNLRATSSAAFRLVPEFSMNVLGELSNSSVSFDAIQMNRFDSASVSLIRPALVKCQRISASAVAQPTHDPVVPWSPTFHHVSRRSFDFGTAAAATARSPAASACSSRQSRSVSRDGTTLSTRRARFGRRFARRLAWGMARP